MKEKLELKHIYGYIFYGLNAIIFDLVCEIEGVDLHWPETIIAERVNYNLSDIKPILRPITDLRKEDSLLYQNLTQIMDAANINNLLDAIENNYHYIIDIRNYSKLEEFMDKHHFDWKYDLIGKGLAVDINTISEK